MKEAPSGMWRIITETATRVMADTVEALTHFEQVGMLPQTNLFGH